MHRHCSDGWVSDVSSSSLCSSLNMVSKRIWIVFVDTVVMDSIKSHVHGFGLFELYSTVYDSLCCRKICLYWCGQLRVAHFFKDLDDFNHLVAIDV